MKQKQILSLSLIALFGLGLAACSNSTTTSSSTPASSIQELKTEHEDVRLNMNKIVIATAANNFQGGTSLEQLTAMFGQFSSQEQKTAGDATLDVYKWQIDSITVEVQLYNNSAIAKSISNFSFAREARVTLSDYEKLQSGQTTYTQAVELLGEPDVLSYAASSDGEQAQAIWTSGLKGNSSQIQLIFTNNVLSSQQQVGLTN